MLVQDLLQNSAEKFPEKIALIHKNQRLTYSEVEQKANRLAHVLKNNGVEQNHRVAIFLPNSVESVISIFGILKASGIFVVINPTTTPIMLQFIDSNSAFLIFKNSYIL